MTSGCGGSAKTEVSYCIWLTEETRFPRVEDKRIIRISSFRTFARRCSFFDMSNRDVTRKI